MSQSKHCTLPFVSRSIFGKMVVLLASSAGSRPSVEIGNISHRFFLFANNPPATKFVFCAMPQNHSTCPTLTLIVKLCGVLKCLRFLGILNPRCRCQHDHHFDEEKFLSWPQCASALQSYYIVLPLVLLIVAMGLGNTFSLLDLTHKGSNHWLWAQVAARMKSCSNMIRDFARTSTKNRFARTWSLSKNKLSLKSGKYVHLTTKGWQTGVILQWLTAFVCHDGVDLDPDLKTLLWTSQNCIGLLLEAKKDSLLLTEPQARQVQRVGQVFVSTYLLVHQSYKEFCPYKLWNPRPKLHLLCHLFDDCQKLKNPLANSCHHDEAWLKCVMAIARKTHKRTTQSSTLKRYVTGLLPDCFATWQPFILQDWKAPWGMLLTCFVWNSVFGRGLRSLVQL